jgi:hypothetical protein
MIQKQPEVTSFYVPYLSFCAYTSRFLAEKFIEPKVKNFFEVRKIDKYDPIGAEKSISDLDFKTVHFSYFYDYILADIKKDKSGKIINEVKYCITFDEEVTSQTCEKTNLKYDEILLNKKPIFYFIYVDFKKIMSFLRQQDRKTLEQM